MSDNGKRLDETIEEDFTPSLLNDINGLISYKPK